MSHDCPPRVEMIVAWNRLQERRERFGRGERRLTLGYRNTRSGEEVFRSWLGGSGGEALVLLTVVGEQDPESVDAESRSKRKVEQDDDTEDDAGDASPGVVLHQSPADEDAAGTDEKENGTDQEENERS